MRLRPRQKTFVERSVAALASHGLGVAPTGAGQTIMVSAVTGEMIVERVRNANPDARLFRFHTDLSQRMPDRGVRIPQATAAGELLPRLATSPDFFARRFCPVADRCWRLEG